MQTCEWFELIISNLIELDNECMNYTAHRWMCLELLELVERIEGYFWNCDRPRFEDIF